MSGYSLTSLDIEYNISMKEVPLDIIPQRHPYIFYRSIKSGKRKLSPTQQSILEKFEEGKWYKSERESIASLNAMLRKGWLIEGTIKPLTDKKDPSDCDGQVLLDIIFGKIVQPITIWRLATEEDE